MLCQFPLARLLNQCGLWSSFFENFALSICQCLDYNENLKFMTFACFHFLDIDPKMDHRQTKVFKFCNKRPALIAPCYCLSLELFTDWLHCRSYV